jgi:hypothetical protein
MLVAQESPKAAKSEINHTQHQVELGISFLHPNIIAKSIEKGSIEKTYVDLWVFCSWEFTFESTFEEDQPGVLCVICLAWFHLLG